MLIRQLKSKKTTFIPRCVTDSSNKQQERGRSWEREEVGYGTAHSPSKKFCKLVDEAIFFGHPLENSLLTLLHSIRQEFQSEIANIDTLFLFL